MKVLFQDYTFTPNLKQIRFNTTDTVTLENVLLITNVSTNTIIYNFANPAQGGTISSNVLTLTYDTTAMLSSHNLQIFLDLKGSPATENTLQDVKEQTALLKRIAKIADSLAVIDGAQRQRITLDAITSGLTLGTVTNVTSLGTLTSLGTVTTVSTVSSVSNIAANAGMGSEQYLNIARNTYANSIRNKLSFT